MWDNVVRGKKRQTALPDSRFAQRQAKICPKAGCIAGWQICPKADGNRLKADAIARWKICPKADGIA